MNKLKKHHRKQFHSGNSFFSSKVRKSTEIMPYPLVSVYVLVGPIFTTVGMLATGVVGSQGLWAFYGRLMAFSLPLPY